MTTENNGFDQKVAPSFYCKMCDYHTSKKYNLDKHLATTKHIIRSKNNAYCSSNNANVAKVAAAKPVLCCENCNKTFNDRAGLWRHSHKCTVVPIVDIDHKNDLKNVPTDKELIFLLLTQNTQLIEQNAELCKNGMHNTINSHNTNSNNKTFNLQFFLNDTCKDAMNITDFVNNIQLQLSDLEKMGEIGYVHGISNIIVKNLKGMDIASRPIHCTDIKREVLYIKDEDKWDKEPTNHPKVRNAIKHIAHKNSKLLIEFKEKNPDYNNSSSKVSDKYNKLLIETMGGKGDNDCEKEHKIIKAVTKEVMLDKICNYS